MSGLIKEPSVVVRLLPPFILQIKSESKIKLQEKAFDVAGELIFSKLDLKSLKSSNEVCNELPNFKELKFFFRFVINGTK